MRRINVLVLTLLTFLVSAAWPQAQGEDKFTTFDAPGAGTGPGQGTIALGMNSARAITGQFLDSSSASHGFLRSRDGTMTTFDAPGAGTGPGQGTQAANINPAGEISGRYTDANNVVHGFLRLSDGTITTFDAPGAGTGPGQGTFSLGNNPSGAITGYYVDGRNFTALELGPGTVQGAASASFTATGLSIGFVQTFIDGTGIAGFALK